MTMQVYVNDKPAQLLPGMTVKHALTREGLLEELKQGNKVYDEWGNELGLDGALSEGAKIFVR
jgi:Cu/Ag efflux protein CusF